MGLLESLADPESRRASHAAIVASAHRGDRTAVARAEMAVRREPARIAIGPDGHATISLLDQEHGGGRFETPTIGELRARISPPAAPKPLRLSLLLGTGPLTDVGALQATAPPGTLFQVASQLNCLESPGPYLVYVADYFMDPTQGPRASMSAWPGTLVRHYAAPDGQGGRFVQIPSRQLDLLADAVPPEVARVESGYLTSQGIYDAPALLAALERHREAVRVGVHADLDVLLGYDFDGEVEGTPRIAQVFTSTYASGYSERGKLRELHDPICRELLRAAYLGTLLAALSLEQRAVVLTAIGGGVFRNPHPVIWEAITWACDQVAPLVARPLDVIVNPRELAVPREKLAADVAARGGLLIEVERELQRR